ncbi:uncharacterized protein N7477_008972 [Penicillium maclennaniae]|uniref:uncharacterized protein n=1 Tax=Penicillium maclennaniae TaxID=1343394 RepID=UPI002541B4E4|nr:uncharacterized protein N7477_008972 [Penicillium maclennaniae]KAJ5666524.1 hypothetical protein N7477_008972 [Penicillium maclennaniae]
MWRWIIGIGVIPGVIALCFRFTIPETPLKAEFDVMTLFNEPIPLSTAESDTLDPAHRRPSDDEHFLMTQSDYITIQPATLNSHYHLVSADIIQYFWTEGNWRTLAGTSLSWLLVDFGFYGIRLSSPHFIAKTWGTLNIRGQVPQWMTNDTPGASVYNMLFRNLGPRKYGFLALAALFIALGTMFITVRMEGPVAVVFYIIGQLLFNFGPNGTTYIIPAEVFPTRYRATCYGISAASGKFGSILAEIFSAYSGLGTGPSDAQTRRHG